MKEFDTLWERVALFDGERPYLDHSTKFHARKGMEEAGEVADAVRGGDFQEIVNESSDVLINYIQLMQTLGLNPLHALHYALSKLDEIERRYPATPLEIRREVADIGT